MLVWSGPGGHGGAAVAALAEKLGLAGREGCGAFYLPETPNGRGVFDAWAASSDDEGAEPESIGVLVISGDEAAANPDVRALAEQAEATIVISMFELEDGWNPDLLLPGTSYLERDGTFVNLEGRLQRLRRTATPPCPDELEWIAELAARFDVDVAPYAAAVFGEVSEKVYGGLAFGEVGEHAAAACRSGGRRRRAGSRREGSGAGPGRGSPRRVQAALLGRRRRARLRAAVPAAATGVELSAEDATWRGIETGDLVTVGTNGAAVTLTARVNRRLRKGIARVALEHANGLSGVVELAKAREEVSA